MGAATDRAAKAELVLSQHKLEPLEAMAPLAEGDPVEAPDVGVRGTIAAIRGDEAEVVGAAGQRVRIPLARLRPSRERAPEERAPVVQVRAAARSDVSDQVDVRGRPAHEAQLKARRLVDEAALAGLREVRVVHGAAPACCARRCATNSRSTRSSNARSRTPRTAPRSRYSPELVQPTDARKSGGTTAFPPSCHRLRANRQSRRQPTAGRPSRRRSRCC